MTVAQSRQPAATWRALSADARWLATVRTLGIRGRVHSVFDRVANVEDHRGELFSVATRDVDNAPNTLVIDLRTFGAYEVREGDRVMGTVRSLEMGKHAVVALDTAVAWHPRRTPYPHDDARLEQNLLLARRHAAGAFGRNTHVAPPGLGARLDVLRDQLGAALSSGAVTAARSCAIAMAGLGSGLTPSGDDVLLGVFAVLNIDASPCARLRPLCTDIVADIGGRTNAISVAALRTAADGRVRESIDTLLTALMTGDERSVRRALDHVLAIGSTSGADIVAGIVTGFDANLQATESRSVRVAG